MLPDPVVPRPIDGVVLVQLKIVPGTELVKMNAPAVAPLHTVVLGNTVATGVGDTFTVKEWTGAGQPLGAVAVTAITATAVTVPVLMAVKDGIGLDEPEAANPIEVLELVHA